MSDLEKLHRELEQDPEYKAYVDEMQPWADVADALIKARVEAGMTQRELAKASGVPQADISRLETCSGNPSLKTLNRLAKCFGLRVKVEFV